MTHNIADFHAARSFVVPFSWLTALVMMAGGSRQISGRVVFRQWKMGVGNLQKVEHRPHLLAAAAVKICSVSIC